MDFYKSFNTIAVLFIILLLPGCGSIFEPKELTEEEKVVLRKKVEVTKTNVIDPLVGIIETSCQHYLKYSTWPKVKFKSSSSSNFESFSILSSSGDQFNVLFKLKVSAINWNVVISESSTKESDIDCNYQITGKVDSRLATIQQTGQYKNGVTFSTEQERMFLASKYFFFTEVAETIPIKPEITKSNKLTQLIGKAFLQVAMCSVLGIEPEHCN